MSGIVSPVWLLLIYFGPQLDAIPTVGYSDPILSYISAFRYKFSESHSMIKEGYGKVTWPELSIHVNLR